MRLRSRLALCLALAGATSSCAPPAHVSGLEIRDPLGLIDDVYASGNELRLTILPSDAYTCDPTSGSVPAWSQDDVEVGMAADAIVDISLPMGELAGREVTVPVGSWTVLVRGRGDDATSGRTEMVTWRTTPELRSASIIV